ncbi:hypothetical protein [Actinomadura fibrosa]|uniref:Uncharacterized protein n=1 Tax=Actinomadura fibrosa TaxID=111802 RepID=A0ABW2XZQ0_9ACTN|nr:hypothetical protein [Actinomadura fibrosa]
MTDDNAAAKQIGRAAKALEAYEQDAFPGEASLLQGDTLYAEALLTGLICDLEHYATTHGINFSETVRTGHSINLEEVADQAPYTVGAEVQLLRQPGYCGTIIGWGNTASGLEQTFLIEVPGIPYIFEEPTHHLASAPAFPVTSTTLGDLQHADQAEQAYADLAAQLPRATTAARPVIERDCQALITALSSWSGVPTPLLEAQHRSRFIRGSTRRPQSPARSPRKHEENEPSPEDPTQAA